MANPTTGFFETHVLPAVASIQRPSMFRNAMLSRIYTQPQPQPGRIGQTINVNIPTVNEGDVIDIGGGPIQITDEDHATVALTVNNNKSISRLIGDFDALRTPLEVKQFYLQPMIEALTRKINRQVCNLVTTGNFNVHSSITAGADTVTRAQFSQAWGNLRSVGAPDDPEDQYFCTSHSVWANMIGDDANKWITESIVGIDQATQAQQRAQLAPQFNTQMTYDQQFPSPSAGVFAALAFHRSAIALIPVTPSAEPKPNVQETFYQVPGSGLTFRIQYGYSLEKQGWVLHAHAVFALAVVRPNYGSFLVTT